MRSLLVFLFTVIFLLLSPYSSISQNYTEYAGSSFVSPEKIPDNTYSYLNNLKKGFFSLYSDRVILYSFAASGLFANTGIDESLRSSYDVNIRSKSSNDLSRIVKPLGNGRITFPSYVAGYMLGKAFNNNSLAEWSKNSFNASLISAPGLLASQYLLGASRPYMEYGSKWWIGMDGKNGASGHTWIAAIPFITTAKMTSNKYLKILLYTASTFAGISRVNDDAHYASQVLLGYAWAYCSVNSVLQNMGNETVRVNVGQSGIGFTVSF